MTISRHADFKRLVIVGAGGAGREIARLAEQSNPGLSLCFAVDRAEYLRRDINGVRVHLLTDLAPDAQTRFVIAIGDPSARQRLAGACAAQGLEPTVLIHPQVEVSSSVEVGGGSLVCAGTIITTDVSIGAHVYVNVGCSISHDVHIGDFTTLSPGVRIAGNVQVGSNVFIGMGTNIINGENGAPLLVGDGAVIAAGSCVTGAVEAGAFVAGAPAVRKR